jgi:hypothetical protein
MCMWREGVQQNPQGGTHTPCCIIEQLCEYEYSPLSKENKNRKKTIATFATSFPTFRFGLADKIW